MNTQKFNGRPGLDPALMMRGDLMVGNSTVARGGFLHADMSGSAAAYPAVGANAVTRGDLARALGGSLEQLERSIQNADPNAKLERAEFTGNIKDVLDQMNLTMRDVQRALTVNDVPVRENMEAPAISLVPEDTPLRNLLPRVPGSGKASVWQQQTTLGGGWGTGFDQPGGGTIKRMFYSETGAPTEYNSVYVPKTAAYKLLGAFGKVTNFAVAAGANYQDQLARERISTLKNTMLNEEYALIHGDSTATAAPWGDGSNALAFDGLYNLVTVANGTPSAAVQSSVGSLTKAHIDNQLTDIWKRGGTNMWMLLNAIEIMSLTRLVEADGSVLRVQSLAQDGVVLGYRVIGYVHPVSGEMVRVLPSRLADPGTMLFGSLQGPDGENAIEVEVLPQVPVPTGVESPQGIQGYTVTDLARSQTAPDVSAFMISVYEVLKVRNAEVFAKSTGVTAAS